MANFHRGFALTNATTRLPNSLPPTFGKTRVLVWSGDKSSTDSHANFSVSLAEPVPRVVYAEWVSCSMPGYCFSISQFPLSGQTSQHAGNINYWRFVGALTNATNPGGAPFPDVQWMPTTLSKLSVQVFNPDGSVPSVSVPWLLEVDLWYVIE